jgi:predicted esterase
LAPEAPGQTWYPYRFVVPQEDNEPALTAALETIRQTIAYVEDTFSLDTSQIFLAGFSQGACLVAEYLKRMPTHYQGVAIMSGGLIGTDEEVMSILVSGSLTQTPIYIGCDIADSYIPLERVRQTVTVLEQLGGAVSLHEYVGLGHTIHPDAPAFIIKRLSAL